MSLQGREGWTFKGYGEHGDEVWTPPQEANIVWKGRIESGTAEVILGSINGKNLSINNETDQPYRITICREPVPNLYCVRLPGNFSPLVLKADNAKQAARLATVGAKKLGETPSFVEVWQIPTEPTTKFEIGDRGGLLEWVEQDEETRGKLRSSTPDSITFPKSVETRTEEENLEPPLKLYVVDSGDPDSIAYLVSAVSPLMAINGVLDHDKAPDQQVRAWELGDDYHAYVLSREARFVPVPSPKRS